MPGRPMRTLSELPAPVFALATAAAVLVAFSASPLPRITPDAAVYLTGAEQLAESGRFAGCARSITDYAPGYSASLAALVTAGVGSTDAARIVNILATVVLVLGAAALARAAGLGRTGVVLVSLATAVAPATLRNGAAAWSEQLFCALLVLVLLAVLGSGRGLAVRASLQLVAVILLSWALLVTRYSGLFVLPALVLAAWLGSRQLPWRALRVGMFTLALPALPALWYARNVAEGTGPFGSRSPSDDSVGEVIGQAPDGLSSVLLPVDTPLALRIAVLLPLVLAAAFAVRRMTPASAVLGLLVVAYVLGVAYAATRTRLDPVDARLLSPVFVPGAVLVVLGVSGLARSGTMERYLRAAAVVVLAAMVAIAPGVAWYLHDVERTFVLDFPVDCADWPAEYAAARVQPR